MVSDQFQYLRKTFIKSWLHIRLYLPTYLLSVVPKFDWSFFLSIFLVTIVAWLFLQNKWIIIIVIIKLWSPTDHVYQKVRARKMVTLPTRRYRTISTDAVANWWLVRRRNGYCPSTNAAFAIVYIEYYLTHHQARSSSVWHWQDSRNCAESTYS